MGILQKCRRNHCQFLGHATYRHDSTFCISGSAFNNAVVDCDAFCYLFKNESTLVILAEHDHFLLRLGYFKFCYST